MTKKIIGFLEEITVIAEGIEKSLVAKFDTGAKGCSIDKELAKNIGIDIRKNSKTKSIKNVMGTEKRPVIKLTFVIKGKKFENIKTTISDRSNLTGEVLIGRSILRDNFIVDVSRTPEP